MPIQFLVEIFSLKISNPINVETATIATLLIVNSHELSRLSILRAFNKKYIEA